MKPLETIYWLRMLLGMVAALIGIGYGLAVGKIPSFDPLKGEVFPADTLFFMNALSIAAITYIVSYHIIKPRFISRVEKPQKLFTTGIGIYFISWLVLLTLLYTMMVHRPGGAPAAQCILMLKALRI